MSRRRKKKGQRSYKNYNSKIKNIIYQRMDDLFKQANEMFSKNKKLANRYVKLARIISMRYKTAIKKENKHTFCKYCHSYLKIGENCVKRTNKGKITYYCLECKRYNRYPFYKERKEKRLNNLLKKD
jgi:RNase P subunit RPR2